MEYRYKDIIKFNENIWIDYIEVFSLGVVFRHKIKNIPKSHIVSKFNLVPEREVEILKQYKVEE